MAQPSSPFSAAAARQFARSVMWGLGVLAVVAVGGPLLSYRSDIDVARQQMEARMTREVQVHADALALHFRILQAELERLSRRPEVDLHDSTSAPERAVLDIAHHGSSLFAGGVAVLDAEGHRVWSEPEDLFARDEDLSGRAWFKAMLGSGRPVVGASGSEEEDLVISVPVLQDRVVNGAVVGVIDLPAQKLPGASALTPRTELLLLTSSGRTVLPEHPPQWLAQANPTKSQQTVSGDGHNYFAATAQVGSTGLMLVLASDEDDVIGPLRARFLSQLLFAAAVQMITLGLFVMYLRTTYRGFVLMEQRAAEQEKFASLGSAASLIAHEVKNSLNGLVAAASLLEAGGDTSLPARSVRSQADRLKHLATSLLQFSRPQQAQATDVRLDLLARETVAGLRVLPEAEVVDIEVEAPSPVELSCDPLLLTSAVDNLVRNAIEAGAAARDTSRVEAPRVQVRVLRGSGATARIEVEDNAGGPPADFDPRLSSPFVTSKPKGIGLGLSMARRAVEQQGGTLRFERTAEGARFVIELPARTT